MSDVVSISLKAIDDTRQRQSLSSYMVDPAYLRKPLLRRLTTARKSITVRQHYPTVIESVAVRRPFMSRFQDWLNNYKQSATALVVYVGNLIKITAYKVRSMIPQRYYKTSYSIHSGATTYLLTRTQKLITATVTVSMLVIVALSWGLLRSTVPPAGSSPNTPIAINDASRDQTVKPADSSTNTPVTNNSAVTPSNDKSTPASAAAYTSTSQVVSNGLTSTVNATQSSDPDNNIPTSGSPAKGTDPPATDPPAATNPVAGLTDVVQTALQTTTDTLKKLTQLPVLL